MDIKVLGTGCQKCATLEHAVKEAVAELQIEATVSKVEDIVDIMNYGVLRTPGLVIDGRVIVSGRIPSASEIRNFLTQNK